MATTRACRWAERICAALVALVVCAISLIGLRMQWGATAAVAILFVALLSVACGVWFVQALFKVFDRCTSGCGKRPDTLSRPDDTVGRSSVGRRNWSGSAAGFRASSPEHV